jgi:anti-sigma-K factor RskA
MNEPSAELLNGMLRKVAARRSRRRLRSILALAAAVVIAAGGTAAGFSIHDSHNPAVAQEVVQATNASYTALVRYSPTPWGGTAMKVAVTGIPPGTSCKLWIVNAAGQRFAAGTWTIGPGYGLHWYSASSPVAEANVHGFQITSQGTTLLSIPAS